MKKKRVYIVTDLEGCFGVKGPDPSLIKKDPRSMQIKKVMAEQCTHELNAMIKGLKQSGGDAFYVIEGHEGCLIKDGIDEKGVVLKKPGDNGYYLPGTNRKFDGFCLLGHHSKEGIKGGFLAHTMSIRNPQKWYINDIEVGEVGIIYFWMQEAGIPMIHVTGGNRLYDEVLSLNHDTVFTTTKIEKGFTVAQDKPRETILKQIEENSKISLNMKHECVSHDDEEFTVSRRFIAKSPLQAIKIILFVTIKRLQSKGRIQSKGLYCQHVKNKSVRNAINLILGFEGKY